MAASFRVIIIGAGPCGIYMAAALHAASIDFIVLERGQFDFTERGNHFILWPHTARLLHQLGLYEELRTRSYDLSSKVDIMRDGTVMDSNEIWADLREQHGYAVSPVQRCELLETLCQSIPDREKHFRAYANVSNIEETSESVVIHLEDGTSETGSIAIGADGTWSPTRAYVEDQASISARQAHGVSGVPMKSEYCSIFGEAPNKNGIPKGIFFETRTTDHGTQLGTDGNLLRFVLYKKLPTPTKTRVRYTREDMENVAEAFSDIYVTPDVKMGDIWPNVYKKTARLVGQNEVIASHWHTDRVVLVGDAAMTMTAVNALGVNIALHSAAVLASEIQQLVSSRSSSDQKAPSSADLSAAFARYQRIRYKGSKPVFDVAYMAMRQMTWYSWKDWFYDRYLTRWGSFQSSVRRQVHAMVSKGQILTYVPFKDIDSRMAWERKPSPSL